MKFQKIYLKIVMTVTLVFIITQVFTTTYMAIGTVSYFLMVSGLYFKKNRQIHSKLMGSAIFLDLGVVLTLEIKRNAIQTALSFALGPLQQGHIGVSIVAAILYIPILIFGMMRLNGSKSKSVRSAHITLGITAFVFRTLGFFLMFSMLEKHA